MSIRLTTIVLLTLLAFSLAITCLPRTVFSKIINVPSDYPQIQQAIDNASPGDIIHVASGTYSENLRITKPLSLVGDSSGNTFMMGSGTVVLVNANRVEIKGFTISGGSYGIFLWHSSEVVLRDTVMVDNKWNFGVWGDILSHFIHDIDFSNTVDGKPVCFWVNQRNRQVPVDAGYVALVNSTGIIVRDVSLTSNEQGVILVNTTDSVVENVTMSGNDEGIVLRVSSNNTLRRNNLLAINWHAFYLLDSNRNVFYENLVQGGTYGLAFRNSSENVLYHNNLVGNKEQVSQEQSFNTWDNGAEGNYWSDYDGADTDGNGVGDTNVPHLGVDSFPLMLIYDKIPPIAEAGGNRTAFRDAGLVFDASHSRDNIGIADYVWSFGEGSNVTGISVTHVYAVAGVYTVSLTVTDLSGNTATDMIVVTVVDPPVTFPPWIFLAIFGAAITLAAAFLVRRRLMRRGEIKYKR